MSENHEEQVEGVFELHSNKDIPSMNIHAILAPSPVEDIAKRVFKNIPIIEAPMVHGHLALSRFTISLALSCEKLGPGNSCDIFVPDYRSALKQMIKQTGIQQFATHITRIATKRDLRHPYYKRSSKEQEEYTQETALRIRKNIEVPLSQGNMERRWCSFTPDPYAIYAVPKAHLDQVVKHSSYYETINGDTLCQKTGSHFALIYSRSSVFKKASHGGLRDKVDMYREGCPKLSNTQLEHLRNNEQLITVEKGMNRSGKETFIITCPMALKDRAQSICLHWNDFQKNEAKEKAIILTQTAIRTSISRGFFLSSKTSRSEQTDPKHDLEEKIQNCSIKPLV